MRKSFLGLLGIAAMMGATMHEVEEDKNLRSRLSRLRSTTDTVLTPAQAKRRAKSKRAKQARKLNR